MKAIVVLMDSLNRHYLSAYGNDWVHSENIGRFAGRSVRFDNHWLGSAPCMPARRDMLTGRLNFLERPWSGMEPYDVHLASRLAAAGVHCHMETDHYHYFYGGGEGYHTEFTTWRGYRGQELDRCAGATAAIGEPEHLGKWSAQYERNRRGFGSDADYPTPRTFAGAIDWLRRNQGADNYLLWVEVFDPHEPFDCPEEYVRLYEDRWDGPLYNWSGYETVEEADPATEHLRRQYAATLTMADRWFGKLLDEIERQGGLEDTLIILTTDHGHLVGEHGATGKNNWHCWNELARLPLLVHLPGGAGAGSARAALTQNVDLVPTLLEFFGVPLEHAVHGESWWPILHDDAPARRPGAIYGWFGQTVNVTDGRYTYLRAPARDDNQPLYEYFLMPTRFHGRFTTDPFREAEFGRFLPHVDVPVLRTPVRRVRSDHWRDTLLFDLSADPGQRANLAGTDVEADRERLLIDRMRAVDSPSEQFDRLGLEV